MVLKHARSARRLASLPAFCLAFLLATAAAHGGGFAVGEQDAASTGLAGAVTARPGDPATLYYNPGAAAFFDEPASSFGALVRATQTLAFGTEPSPDTIGTSFDSDDPSPVLPLIYTVQPIRGNLNLGVAVYSPFDHDLQHGNPSSFPGRTIALSSAVRTLDASFSASFKVGQNLGVGVGAIVRASTFDLERRLQALGLDNQPVDFASLDVESDPRVGLGFQLGVLHRLSPRFFWGVSYRSEIQIEYEGTGLLEQIETGDPFLDDALAGGNPFGEDLPMFTEINFPDTLSLGVGLHLTRRLYLGADVSQMGWSSIDQIDVRIPTFPRFNNTIDLGLDDAFAVRVGTEYTFPKGTQLRFGLAFDESPQAEGRLSPFLLDSDRSIVSVGLGRDWLQIAAQWITYSDRSGTMSDSLGGSFGGDAWQVLLTLRRKSIDRSALGKAGEGLTEIEKGVSTVQEKLDGKP